MAVRYDIEFAGEQDVALRGWLFVPEIASAEPRPAISMCHGYAAVKEHALEKFAQAFAEAGFVVMVHDHRNFGASDGTPRHDIDPWMQIEDWRRAISFLESRTEVDASRIGIWGSSYSGGHALVLAATDPRVKCVVSQVPTISGFEQSRRRVSPDGLADYLDNLISDLRSSHAGEAPGTQAVVSGDLSIPAAYRSEEAQAFYLRDVGTATWPNTVTLRSSFAARMYEPGAWISRISPRPLLMIVATDDRVTLTDLELRAYEDALEPKRLITIAGGHFSPYDSAFFVACAAATDWFRLHLAP
ncbi:alpha/beta hydrolase [Cupriavidus numazuensis]|uniref:Quorum-quenching protein AidA n=1 Tax=Cupriavidus numazuensis TaxID=221992 RepID=A0ABM8TVD1_9BURK|nr:alpha/beta hydrolase [Cupriavidus numazuensis]CAG2160637.1 Quorum-quenching protein AidA [Cupriavidus numazuensis]